MSKKGKEIPGVTPDTYNFSLLHDIGYEVAYCPTMPTTMTFVEHFARKDSATVFVGLTDHQENGIGREGRVWHDKKGASILMSIYFPMSDPTAIGIFADIAALQTCLALRTMTGQDTIGIKYPNDLVANGKKVGGILVRTIQNGDTFIGANVGIGINVHYTNRELDGYSTDPGYDATSLDLVTGTLNSRQEIVAALLQGLLHRVVDAETIRQGDVTVGDLKKPIDLRRRYDLQWRAISTVMGKEVKLIKDDTAFDVGTVTDTQVGRGILLDNTRWWNAFEASMKVRIT